MKKIIFCILVLLTSCQVNHYDDAKPEGVESIRINFGSFHRLLDITKFQYEEHSYIMFDGCGDRATILHDPDCPCHNTITNESDVSRPND